MAVLLYPQTPVRKQQGLGAVKQKRLDITMFTSHSTRTLAQEKKTLNKLRTPLDRKKNMRQPQRKISTNNYDYIFIIQNNEKMPVYNFVQIIQQKCYIKHKHYEVKVC